MDEPRVGYDALEWLTLADAADYLHLSRSALYRWHCQRKGPRAYKVGQSVMYRRLELNDWIESGGNLDPWPPEWGPGARRPSTRPTAKIGGAVSTTRARRRAS